ncbi:hypothetical protein IJS77_05130 [bacterium]|nr:hypothetical protein [bacterium]
MRKVILCAAILLSVFWIYLLIVNYSYTGEINIPFKGLILTKMSWILLGFGLLTMLIDGLSFIWYLKSKTELNRDYEFKMNKMSVQSDNDKSQIRILENKIKTLEAAIEKLTKKD